MPEKLPEFRRLPDNWKDWRLTGLIGQGAYGEVYRAERSAGDKNVTSAIKIVDIPSEEAEAEQLRRELPSGESIRRYYREIAEECVREIQVMESLKGITNIVSIEDYCIQERTEEIGWTIFIRMELLENIQVYFQEHELTQQEVIRIGTDICTALEYCEKICVVHRDIKPENILRAPHGDYKLGDFGAAKQISRTMTPLSMKGTLSFMAPEVAAGKEYDRTADIYSLGLVLYTLLNHNRAPFTDLTKKYILYSDKTQAFQRRMAGEKIPPPAEAARPLAQAILTALSFEREERFQSASAFKKALLYASQTGTDRVKTGTRVKGAQPEKDLELAEQPEKDPEMAKGAEKDNEPEEVTDNKKPNVPAGKPVRTKSGTGKRVVFLILLFCLVGLGIRILKGRMQKTEKAQPGEDISRQTAYEKEETSGELDIDGRYYASDDEWSVSENYYFRSVTVFNRTAQTLPYSRYTEKLELKIDDGSSKKVTLVYDLPKIGAGEKKQLQKKISFDDLKIDKDRSIKDTTVTDEIFS